MITNHFKPLSNVPREEEPSINADRRNDHHPDHHFGLFAFSKQALDWGAGKLLRGEIDTSSSEGYTFIHHRGTDITVLIVWSVEGVRSARRWLRRYVDGLSLRHPGMLSQTGSSFLHNVENRLNNREHYPRQHYDTPRARLVPVLATTDEAGIAVESTLMHRSLDRGTSTNQRIESTDGLSWSQGTQRIPSSASRPMTAYFNPSIYSNVQVHHARLTQLRIEQRRDRPSSELNESSTRFLCRNSETGELGSQINQAQGRRIGGGRYAGNNFHDDTEYIEAMVELVSNGVVTPAEIRKTWSPLNWRRQPRKSAGAWRDLLKAKKKADPTLVIRINMVPRQHNDKAFKQLQSAVLRHFAP